MDGEEPASHLIGVCEDFLEDHPRAVGVRLLRADIRGYAPRFVRGLQRCGHRTTNGVESVFNIKTGLPKMLSLREVAQAVAASTASRLTNAEQARGVAYQAWREFRALNVSGAKVGSVALEILRVQAEVAVHVRAMRTEPNDLDWLESLKKQCESGCLAREEYGITACWHEILRQLTMLEGLTAWRGCRRAPSVADVIVRPGQIPAKLRLYAEPQVLGASIVMEARDTLEEGDESDALDQMIAIISTAAYEFGSARPIKAALQKCARTIVQVAAAGEGALQKRWREDDPDAVEAMTVIRAYARGDPLDVIVETALRVCRDELAAYAVPAETAEPCEISDPPRLPRPGAPRIAASRLSSQSHRFTAGVRGRARAG
jgi:hypothetical protein